MDSRLVELKIKWNNVLEWGKLYGNFSEDGKVLEFGWKDQNVVLFMIIVLNGWKTVKRFRRRFTKIVTNARIFRAMFGEQVRKELFIFEFIDMYNYYMNGVDNVDQLRCYYFIQRVYFKI